MKHHNKSQHHNTISPVFSVPEVEESGKIPSGPDDLGVWDICLELVISTCPTQFSIIGKQLVMIRSVSQMSQCNEGTNVEQGPDTINFMQIQIRMKIHT